MMGPFTNAESLCEAINGGFQYQYIIISHWKEVSVNVTLSISTDQVLEIENKIATFQE
jgi:hypothetical protein